MKRVTLSYGLIQIMENPELILKSSGLEKDEYIKYVKGYGFCFEDDCLIARHIGDVKNCLEKQRWSRDSEWFLDSPEKELEKEF